MSLLATYLMPHPPIILSEIGCGEEKKIQNTINSMLNVSKEIALLKPETIIVISPHGPVFSDGIAIMYENKLEGNFNQFGEYTLKFNKNNDIELIDTFTKILTTDYKISGVLIDLKAADYFGTSYKLDHGTLVPLYFVDKKFRKYQLISIAYGLLSYQDLYKVGIAINQAIEKLNRKAVLIASGDLSHRLKDSGPYDYHESGPEFDRQILDLLTNKKSSDVIAMNPEFCKEAGECAKRSIDIMLGSLDTYEYDAQLLSYEGPFGVGYGVVSFNNLVKTNKTLSKLIEKQRKEYVDKIKKDESECVSLARKTIEEYIIEGKRLSLKDSQFYNSNKLRENRKGVFVSIKDSRGLRGCIGTFLPLKRCIGEEIIDNAIKASTKDPRFPEIEEWELEDLIITVDILETPETINDLEDLNPEIYGVIVTSGYKRGLLLPNLSGINSVEEQLEIAKNKAGISENESCTLQRFKVKRHY